MSSVSALLCCSLIEYGDSEALMRAHSGQPGALRISAATATRRLPVSQVPGAAIAAHAFAWASVRSLRIISSPQLAQLENQDFGFASRFASYPLRVFHIRAVAFGQPGPVH